MATTFTWNVTFRAIQRWKKANKHETFESNTFSLCGAKLVLICSLKDTKWNIRLKCIETSIQKRINIDCQILCKDHNDKNLHYPIAKAITLKEQQCSKSWQFTTTETIKKCSKLNIACTIYNKHKKKKCKYKSTCLSCDELMRKLQFIQQSINSDKRTIKDQATEIERQTKIILHIRSQLLHVLTILKTDETFQFDTIITEECNNNKIVSPLTMEMLVAKDHVLYDKHSRIINHWNKNSTKLLVMSSWNDESLYANDDEKKDFEEDCLGVLLFEKYSECDLIINEQYTRLSHATTDNYLLELINHQNELSSAVKEKESKLKVSLKAYSSQNKQYEILKKQRIELQNKIKREFVKCNEMIGAENKLFVMVKQNLNDNCCVEKQIEQFKSSSNMCLSVIKLYNDFMENNKQYIDILNVKFEKLWNEFESKWMRWTVADIIAWFKYKTLKMNTNKIDWKNTDKQLKNRNITGKSLVNFNNLVFELIGIQDFDVVTHLVNAINELTDKYNDKKIKASLNKKKVEIPKRFLCGITKQIMRDPVIAFDGHSYERNAIESYL
eukprot:408085_1